MRMAAKMIRPPIVGVPDFSSCPAKPKSRTVSPICCKRKRAMIRLPMMTETTSEVMSANEARNEMN